MNKEEEIKEQQSRPDCEETHHLLTVESLAKLHKQLNRRYWMLSIGLMISALGVSISLGVYNPTLGIACFLAEIVYIVRVNMINVSSARVRIKEVLHYLNHEEVITKQSPSVTDHNRGQYI